MIGKPAGRPNHRPPASVQESNGTMATVRKRVLYAGHVQGVGFRYTTQGIARGFPVAGFVRNLPDGRVELVAEGEADGVRAFLAAVAGRWADVVTDAVETDEPAQGLAGFTIRR